MFAVCAVDGDTVIEMRTWGNEQWKAMGHELDAEHRRLGIKPVKLGDRAKIERGPFSEFVCTVDQIKDDRRAWVLIDLLQQQTRAEVSLDDVSKIH